MGARFSKTLGNLKLNLVTILNIVKLNLVAILNIDKYNYARYNVGCLIVLASGTVSGAD